MAVSPTINPKQVGPVREQLEVSKAMCEDHGNMSSPPFLRERGVNEAKFMRICEQLTTQNGFLTDHGKAIDTNGKAIAKLLRRQIQVQEAIKDLQRKQAEMESGVTDMGQDVDDHSFQINRHEILIQGIQSEVDRLKSFRHQQERISQSSQRFRGNQNNGSSKPRVTCNTCGSEISATYLPKHLTTKKCQRMKLPGCPTQSS